MVAPFAETLFNERRKRLIIAHRKCEILGIGLAVLLLAALLVAPSWAGGVRSVQLPPVTLSTRPITVDGDLAEWGKGNGQKFVPVDVGGIGTGTGAKLAELQQNERSVTVLLRYSAEALYVGLDWRDPTPCVNATPPENAGDWAKGGDGVELHILTDRMVHFASWPSTGGATAMARVGTGNWRDATKKGAAAAIEVSPDGKGYAQEIRIPWKVITSSGRIPSDGKLELMFDFAWNDFCLDALKALPPEILRRNTHFTYNFLTSRRKLFSRGYLPDPADWGELVFAEKPQKGMTERSPLGTGATVMHVAPPPAEVNVDGKLDEWRRLDFQEFTFAPGFLDKRYSGTLAAMYDAHNFYVAAHFTTPVPMINDVREVTQMGFAGGDCLQIRLNKGALKRNLCAWYDAVGQKPALTADGRELKDPFLLRHGAEEAFRPDPDGKGYTQEIRIPWKAILGEAVPAPRAGDVWRATFQPWWKGLNPQFTLHAKTTLEKRGALSLAYTMPRDAMVTLGLFNGEGELLRWIVQNEYRYAGPNREYWNGLDQWGKPVPAGAYTVKGVLHDPLSLEYQMTLANPGNPPWPTADGKGDWLSDEASAQAAVTDGKWVFLAAPGSEKGFAVIAVDESGQRQWGVDESFYPRCVSLALNGDFLYALFSGPELTDATRRFNGKNAVGRAVLICYDKTTGRRAAFSEENPRLKVHTWPYREAVVGLWDLRRNMTFRPGNYGGQPRYFCADLGESTNALGVAAAGPKLYVSLFYEDRLLVLDAETAEPAGEIPLPKPVGLHALDDHTLLAVSDGRVVKLNVRDGTRQVLIDHHLEAPHSVTTDKEGRIYVSDWGKSFQVKVFSPAGEYLRAIGRPGGRPWLGQWDEGGMLVPRGIAVTDRGDLWVAEDDASPRRISVWDAETGRFLRDYIGPAAYGGGDPFAVDPDDPTIMYALGTRFKVDFERKTYRPLAIVTRRMHKDQPFALNGHYLMVDGQKSFRHEGKQYVVIKGYHRIVIALRQGDIFVPVAAAGGNTRLVTDDGTGRIMWDSDVGYHLFRNFYPEFFRGHAGDNFSWADLNGDGLVQPEEMTWAKTVSRFVKYTGELQPEWHVSGGAAIGPDWSIYFSGSCHGGEDKEALFRLDLKGWTSNGAPIYDIRGSKLLRVFKGAFVISGLYVNAENRLFVSHRHRQRDEEPVTENSVGCYDREGSLLWNIASPSKALRKSVVASNVIGEFDIPGLGNVVCTWNWWWNNRPYLITSDGLYVGTVLEETRIGPAALWGEAYNHFFQTPDGTPYIVNGASDGHHIHRIVGLENAARLEFPLELTQEDVRSAEALRKVPQGKELPKSALGVAWLDPATTIDGDLKDWDMNRGVLLDGGRGRTAEVALGRDEEMLYLAYKVNDKTPLLNSGQNWQTLFISGDCVDLMLATDPEADPHRREAAAGDLRLLMGVYGDKPIAVLYRPVIPGDREPVRLMAANIDEIAPLETARVAFRRGEDRYTIEAAVPLADLNIDLAEKGQLRGDVGVVYSDETGRDRELRLYYYNRNTHVVSDLTTEATLQPAEWGVIQFPLGKNLLRNGSFEGPFAEQETTGWRLQLAQNGATARMTSQTGYTGRRCLLIEQVKPVAFPEAAFHYPEWKDFVKAANDGKGGGHVSIAQRVPVQAGKKYALRLHYRSSDLYVDHKRPGPDRGYAAMKTEIFWAGNKGSVGGIWLMALNRNNWDWQEALNPNTTHSVNRPYAAPDGATMAIISFKFSVCAPARLSKVYVDDAEFVELAEKDGS